MSLTAETELGCLQGAAHGGVVQFRGVPYARPPLGGLRFRPLGPLGYLSCAGLSDGQMGLQFAAQAARPGPASGPISWAGLPPGHRSAPATASSCR